MSKHGLWVAIALGAGVLAMAGCSSQAAREEGAAGGPLVAVRAGALEMRTFEDVVTAPGEWRSTSDLSIVAPFAAMVESVRPSVGDAVRRGETIGWLVPRESDAAVRGADLLAREARDSLGRAEAEQAVRAARHDLVRVPVVSPQSGVVTGRAVADGAQIAEGGEILAIAVRGDIRFEARVDARDAGRLRSGQRAAVACEGQAPQPTVFDRLLPSAGEGDQAALAWLIPAVSSRVPQLGRFGTARIVVGAPRRALAAPDSAFVEDDLTGETRLAVVGADGRAHWRTVALGAAAAGWHEIKGEALPAGSRVIIEGQHGLPEATRVRIAP